MQRSTPLKRDVNDRRSLEFRQVGWKIAGVNRLVTDKNFQFAVATTAKIRHLQPSCGHLFAMGSPEAQGERLDFCLTGSQLRHSFMGWQAKLLLQFKFVIAYKNLLITQVGFERGFECAQAIKAFL